MKKILAALMIVMGLMGASASAQTTTNSTTLAAAVTSVSQSQIQLTSASTVAAGQLAFVDKETMYIVSLNGVYAQVTRGYSGSRPSTHASGATIYTGPTGSIQGNAPFISYDQAGSCTATNEAYLPQINSLSGNIWQCTAAAWVNINPVTAANLGAATGTSLTTTGDITTSAGKYVSGTANTTAGSLKFFNATSGSITLAPTTGALGTVTATFPAASITVPGTVMNDCATANACSATNRSTTMKVVTGVTAALDGASPSVAAVTGMPAFTSSATYHCAATSTGATAAIAAGGVASTNVSSSAVTFTSANGLTNVVHYICIGW